MWGERLQQHLSTRAGGSAISLHFFFNTMGRICSFKASEARLPCSSAGGGSQGVLLVLKQGHLLKSTTLLTLCFVLLEVGACLSQPLVSYLVSSFSSMHLQAGCMQ